MLNDLLFGTSFTNAPPQRVSQPFLTGNTKRSTKIQLTTHATTRDKTHNSFAEL